METDKLLYHFQKESDFLANQVNLPNTGIAFVKDSQTIYTHEKEYNMVSWGELVDPYIKKENTVAGDICVSTADGLKFVRDEIQEGDTPIGVVVVPASHTDDGTARVMSLASMDYDNPDNGNTDEYVDMYWGGYGNDIPTLKNCQYSPRINTDLDNPFEDTQRIIDWTGSDYYLPSDYYFGTSNEGPTNPYDTVTCYVSNSSYCCPSPYLNDGSKNPLYSQVYDNGSGIGNRAEEMDGRVNTAAILAIDNGGSTDWQTAATISNAGSTSTIHPAAQCCWRYHTVGTNQGDWYLPSAGELGYLAVRWKVINSSISKIAPALGLSDSFWLWSSTESSHILANILVFKSSGATLQGGNGKNRGISVRAFLAV